MTLEETLTQLGDSGFSAVPNYRAVLAYVNGSFTKASIAHVDGNTPSDKVLEQIYAMVDTDLQQTLLARPIKDLLPDNKFKKVMVVSGILITAVLTAVVLISIFSQAPLTPEMIGLIKDIVSGIFDVIKALISST